MLTVLAEAALRSCLLGAAVWIGLTVLRVRNPHAQMTSYVVVLLASLSMPLLMHWTPVAITLAPLPMPTPDTFWPVESSLPEPFQASPASLPDIATAITGHTPESFGWSALHKWVSHWQAFDWTASHWKALATAIYASVAGLLLFRLAIGIHLTWRLARAAKPMNESWVANSDVRVSDDVGGPVTFGSTILVPPQCSGWDSLKRQAVIAHEGAHVANRDFYVLLLASLNRAIFWFSPFAWWQQVRLAELAEIISDARAIEVVEDRVSYAEVLLDLVQSAQPKSAGLAMARACTIRARVEHILAVAAPPPRVSWRKRLWIAAAIVPIVMASAGMVAYRTETATVFSAEDPESPTTTGRQWQTADFYAFDSRSVFAVLREGDDVFGQLTGQRKLHLSRTTDGTYSYPATSGRITVAADAVDARSSALTMQQNGREMRAARIAEMPRPVTDAGTSPLDPLIGWYELAPNRVLTVTPDGGRMHAQETGQAKFELTAEGKDAFSDQQDDHLVFLRDDQGKIAQILLSDRMSGARLARRVDAARAKTVEDKFARRMAEAPDRFREQIPATGGKEAILRGIADMQNGTPNYDRMSAVLASNIRRQVPEMQPVFASFGAVESIFFRGVSPAGYDIYGVKFANGSAEFRLLLGADGKADDVIFRPDGNEQPGGVVACSGEPRLSSKDGNAPIKILIYNNSGDDIQLYHLDSNGNRTAHGMIGDNMSSSILTQVGASWVIADRAGQCLEILLPGQRTRYHAVEASTAGASADRSAPARTTPMAGAEERLREFILALSRGQPNYDRMTSEVAVQTRQQLAFDQAILAKLGALRAVSFRGVTALGSDVYFVQFANGSAEWRIGLAKNGTIGRIALGPQF